ETHKQEHNEEEMNRQITTRDTETLTTVVTAWPFTEIVKLPCARYVLEGGVTVGCQQPYDKLLSVRFDAFTTTLVLGNNSSEQIHHLKYK
ncbi:hypothetical protein CRUP_031993, partial [Coryphaenoides rupestris]